MEQNEIKPKKNKVMKTIVTIVVILLIFIGLYITKKVYIAEKRFGNSFGLSQIIDFSKKEHINYVCTLNGETVYLKTSYENNVNDGFQNNTLYDKNHIKIDSGISGGIIGIQRWNNNIGQKAENCVKN